MVKIKDEDSELVTRLLEKLGAEVLEKKVAAKKKTGRNVSPTFLFGKWKGLDIDARKLREEAWDRSHKFL